MTEGSPTLKDHSASGAMRIIDALASSMLCISRAQRKDIKQVSMFAPHCGIMACLSGKLC